MSRAGSSDIPQAHQSLVASRAAFGAEVKFEGTCGFRPHRFLTAFRIIPLCSILVSAYDTAPFPRSVPGSQICGRSLRRSRKSCGSQGHYMYPINYHYQENRKPATGFRNGIR